MNIVKPGMAVPMTEDMRKDREMIARARMTAVAGNAEWLDLDHLVELFLADET